LDQKECLRAAATACCRSGLLEQGPTVFRRTYFTRNPSLVARGFPLSCRRARRAHALRAASIHSEFWLKIRSFASNKYEVLRPRKAPAAGSKTISTFGFDKTKDRLFRSI
jgi:hypothetical protein